MRRVNENYNIEAIFDTLESCIFNIFNVAKIITH